MEPTGFAAAYQGLWTEGTYDRHSQVIDPSTTLLLSSLIERLHQQAQEDGSVPHVFEGGAGSGDHAVILAQHGFLVTANEFDSVAVERIRQQSSRLDDPSLLRVAQGDMVDCVRAQERASLSGFYANSVLHTFSGLERSTLYTEVEKAQRPDGFIAVSFKREGDALQEQGRVIERTEAGEIVEDQFGIKRLFVARPQPLVRELEQVGYGAVEISTWELAQYIAVRNYQSGTRRFIGLLAQKTGR